MGGSDTVPLQEQPDANVGSRARDHLANERTFLAWVRTTLGMLALGVAFAKFGSEGSRDTTALAAFIIAVSIAALGLATLRYYRVASDLDSGRFVVDKRSPIIILCAAIAMTAAVAALAF